MLAFLIALFYLCIAALLFAKRNTWLSNPAVLRKFYLTNLIFDIISLGSYGLFWIFAIASHDLGITLRQTDMGLAMLFMAVWLPLPAISLLLSALGAAAWTYPPHPGASNARAHHPCHSRAGH